MPPRISVVIPTYNRRHLLGDCLGSLERQTLPCSEFEVIVVVDGSTDGTEELLSSYDDAAPYPFRHVVSENRGLSAARNIGNRMAQADIVLCLDDDMITAPELLAEHVRTHATHPGCLVQGGLAIHESVARTPYLVYEERLLGDILRGYEDRGVLTGEEIFGGNISIARGVLADAGGFNEALKGLRNTDGDLAHRLEERGVPIRYNGRALSHMTHMKDLAQSLRSAYLNGRSYVRCVAEAPEVRWKRSPLVLDRSSRLRNALRRFLYLPPRAQWGLGWLERALAGGTALAESMHLSRVAAVLYRLGLDFHYWKGVFEEAAGATADLVPRPVSILCYHNVSPDPCPPFRMYVLSPQRFAHHMQLLAARGYEAVSLDALAAYLYRGGPLPPKPVAITFDDGYQDLKQHATPLLADLGLHHTHFINTGKMGKATDWVTAAPDLPLMDAGEIRTLAQTYGDHVAFQAHGRNHLACSELEAAEIHSEVGHCVETLEPLTSRAVRFFAYPYGMYDSRTPAAMAGLPIECSFSVDQGLCRPGQNPHLIPRVEIFSNDLDIDFVCKLRFGWSPIATTRAILKAHYKRALRILGRLRPRTAGA